MEAQKRRWFGIDRVNSKPSILGEREYDLTTVGYKYHMNDLAAAVGLGNLESYPQKLKRISEIAKLYRNELRGIPGLQLLDYKDDRESAYWLFTLLVERREDFIKALKERGVPTSVVHLSIDRYSVFGGLCKDLVNQKKFNNNQIAIPIHKGLTDNDVERVIAAVKSGW